LVSKTAGAASLTDYYNLWFIHCHTITEESHYFFNFLTPERFPSIQLHHCKQHRPMAAVLRMNKTDFHVIKLQSTINNCKQQKLNVH